MANPTHGLIALSFDIRREERRGITATTAMGAAPMLSAPERTARVANTAIFRGEIGYGLSVAHRFATEAPLAATAGFACARGGNTVARVGMAGEF